MVIEEHIDIAVAPHAVMACYRDVGRWHEWDPDTKAASIDGPFRAGVTGRLTPGKGFTVSMRLSQVSATSFTVECLAPLCTMRFEHDLHLTEQGTRVVHRVSFHGVLARFFSRLVGARVQLGLPVTLARLKLRLEQQAISSTRRGK